MHAGVSMLRKYYIDTASLELSNFCNPFSQPYHQHPTSRYFSSEKRHERKEKEKEQGHLPPSLDFLPPDQWGAGETCSPPFQLPFSFLNLVHLVPPKIYSP
jgi:hypothetical protein